MLNTVEAYDHIAGSWAYTPNMIEERLLYKSVSVKNKFIAVRGLVSDAIEAFDLRCNKFVLVEPMPLH